MTPPLDCHAAMRALWDFLDAECPPADAAAMEAHLATCAGCRDHVAFARRFLRRLREAQLPRDDVARMQARVREALLSA
ncbi:MAG: zf-HC2 domain-containing protein [Gemmatimonadales bacterium]|nr:zf-HC2 domain-containing protein [Gemmatimonadales bacterium]